MRFILRRSFAIGCMASLTACLTTKSAPEPRDTSRDKPQLVREIESALSAKASGKTFDDEPKTGNGALRPGWAIYKLTDKDDGKVTISVHQVLPVAGDAKRFWLEMRSVDPANAVVTRQLLHFDGKAAAKANQDERVNVGQVVQVERMINWVEGQPSASEVPESMVRLTSAAVGQIFVAGGADKRPRRRVVVTGGTFAKCIVTDSEAIPLLRAATQSCISANVPVPYVVLSDSEDRRMELLSFGFGVKPSLLPANVKVETPGVH